MVDISWLIYHVNKEDGVEEEVLMESSEFLVSGRPRVVVVKAYEG